MCIFRGRIYLKKIENGDFLEFNLKRYVKIQKLLGLLLPSWRIFSCIILLHNSHPICNFLYYFISRKILNFFFGSFRKRKKDEEKRMLKGSKLLKFKSFGIMAYIRYKKVYNISLYCYIVNVIKCSNFIK